MFRRPRAPLAALLIVVLTALGSSACQGPPPIEAQAAPHLDASGALTNEVAEPVPFPAYAANARARKDELRARLAEVIVDTRPLMVDVQGRLARKIDALEPPLRFATREPRLRQWGIDRQHEFQAVVQDAYDRTHETLATLYDSAAQRGLAAAQALTAVRSPLDGGATGNRLIDATMVAFDETLDGMFDFPGMELHLQQDVLRRTEMFERFSSFNAVGSDELLGGRLMLFVGGEQRSGGPSVRLVLRCAEGVEPANRHFYQVARHRVMRGSTVVHDTDWRAYGGDDGMATRHAEEEYVFAADIAPALNIEGVGFDKLRDMRVVVDLQTAVLDNDQMVLGGVNWRIEFHVTLREDTSWSLGALPVFDPGCPELVKVLTKSGR